MTRTLLPTIRLRIGQVFIAALVAVGSLQAQVADRVVLVIIDGMRYSESLGDASGTFAPRLKELAVGAAVVDTFVNDNITKTQWAIPAIWTGSWSTPIDTTVDGHANQYCSTPTVWEYFRKKRGGDSTTAIYFTKYLTTPWMPSFSSGYGPAVWPWYISEGATDRDVWQIARTVMGAQHPVLSVIYLADVDHYGHSGNWANYTHAIGVADSIVDELWTMLGIDSSYAGRTVMFVTDDHGRHDPAHGDFTNHGDGCWGCRHIMLLAKGAGIQPGHSTVRRSIPDIVPTIGSILGFPTPFSSGHAMTEIASPMTAVKRAETAPGGFRLEQNFPNPFNPTTVVRYTVPVVALSLSKGGNERALFVTLKVYDMLGREVATLVNRTMTAGTYTVTWNAAAQPSGAYLCELRAGANVSVRRMILLK